MTKEELLLLKKVVDNELKAMEILSQYDNEEINKAQIWNYGRKNINPFGEESPSRTNLTEALSKEKRERYEKILRDKDEADKLRRTLWGNTAPEGEKISMIMKYLDRPITESYQIDTVSGMGPEGDGLLRADEDGDLITGGFTEDLRGGGQSVRVLIQPDADPKVVAKALRKTADWVEEEPKLLIKVTPEEATAKIMKEIEDLETTIRKKEEVEERRSNFKVIK